MRKREKKDERTEEGDERRKGQETEDGRQEEGGRPTVRGKGSGGKRRMNPPLSLGLRGPPAPLYHPEGESGGGEKEEGRYHPFCTILQARREGERGGGGKDGGSLACRGRSE